MGAVSIQASDFCKQTHKINTKIAWKNSQCEYAKIYHFGIQKIANVNEPLQEIFLEKSLVVNNSVENTSIHHSEKKIAHFTLGKIAQCESALI